MNKRKMSVALCYFLRHDPSKISLSLSKEGWANIDELVEKTKESHCKGLTKEILLEIVAEDEKGRYAVSQDGLKIRCVQGHSNESVKLNLKPKTPPATLYHGTSTRNIGSIMKAGLNSGSRQHVHLSTCKKTAINVGSRHGSPVVLKINAHVMHKKGHLFFEAENGVWLTEYVPKQFLMEE